MAPSAHTFFSTANFDRTLESETWAPLHLCRIPKLAAETEAQV